MYDILIKNGTVIDGSGEPMRRADVAVKGDRIERIGELHDERAEFELDAEGKLLCPGFIDVCNHSDTYWQIFNEPDLESLVYQGITTIVGGNCGSSLAPLAAPKSIESIQKWIDLTRINVNWLSLAEFFNTFSLKPISVNFATLAGHATLRRGVLGDQMRNLAPKELAFLKKKLEESLSEGALGISAGLVYTHARTADQSELVDLAGIIKKHGGVFVMHIREEGKELFESVEEALAVAEKAGVKLHISHLKAVGRKNWPQIENVLEIIDKSIEKGADVTFDVFPYTSTGSVLYTFLPAWVTDGGRKMMLARLKDQGVRAKLQREMKTSGIDFEKIEISASGIDHSLSRRKISEIARDQGKSIEEAVMDILIASGGRVVTMAELLNEENIRIELKKPYSMIATNGAGYGIDHWRTLEMVHPRSFGTTMKIFEKYVENENLLTWEEAVRKMTSLPAEKFNLKRRGRLKEKYFADIAVIDKDQVQSPSNRENPYQYSRGVEYLLVNGKIVLAEGKYKGVRNGKIIKNEK